MHLSRLKYLLILLPASLLLFLFVKLGKFFPGPNDVSSGQFIQQLEKNAGIHPGYRRNHASGLCMQGYFEGNNALHEYSDSAMFFNQKTPFTGRFSLPGGAIHASDPGVPIRSMALNFDIDGSQQWRMALLSAPVFVVANPQDFLQLLQAQEPDPVTGKADGEKVAEFFKSHPESSTFVNWLSHHEQSNSLANSRFNSLNAFYFTKNGEKTQAFRWSMLPVEPFVAMPDADYSIFSEIEDRLKSGPIKWNMEVQLAQANDDVADATIAWPQTNQKILVGTLTVMSGGQCDGINFDPTVTPKGIAVSADPLLAARSAVYARSFHSRSVEKGLKGNSDEN